MGAKHHAGGWTPERVATLTKLWLDGKSAEEIRLALGDGVTRNAVISKIHRTGLHMKRSPEATAASQGAGRKKSGETRALLPKPALPASPGPGAWGRNGGVPVPPSKPAKVAGDGDPLNLTLVALPANGCKWPVNDGRPDFLFCGHPRLDARPYCLGHSQGSLSSNAGLARHSERELVRSVRRFL